MNGVMVGNLRGNVRHRFSSSYETVRSECLRVDKIVMVVCERLGGTAFTALFPFQFHSGRAPKESL